MVHSKPIINTLFALGVFLLIVLSSFFVVLRQLLKSPDFFILKIIIAPILLVIALLVLGKILRNYKHVKFAQHKIEVSYPISRQRFKIAYSDILAWEESVVKTKNGDFKELRLVYAPQKVLKLSNKESSNYEKAVKVIKQKIGGKLIKT